VRFSAAALTQGVKEHSPNIQTLQALKAALKKARQHNSDAKYAEIE